MILIINLMRQLHLRFFMDYFNSESSNNLFVNEFIKKIRTFLILTEWLFVY